MSENIMSWVDALPEVGGPIVKDRDAIAAKMAEAEALQRRAEELRAAAYVEACRLESRVASLFTAAEIVRAKAQFA